MWTPVAYPEEVGISSLAVEAFLDGAKEQGLEFHSVILLRQGKVAARMAWKPYDDVTPHTLFSLSKSFCSAAAGFAVAEGLLSYEDKVLDVLKDKAPEHPDKGLQKVTLKHLLTMSSGLEPKSDQGRFGYVDWVKRLLACKTDHEPGTHFHYNSMGTYLVSAMVQKVTGQTIRDYLMPRLFDKLDIPLPQWDCCPMGINAGGFGLHLSGESIAKFGQLLLQDGLWDGKRVLPKGWVKLATDKSIETVDKPEDSDWAQGYGFQFWRTRGNRYRGDGMFGQVCLVDEKNDVVIAVTAGIPDMGAEMQLLQDTLLKGVAMPPASAAVQKRVKARIAKLAYDAPTDDGAGRDLTGSYVAGTNNRLRLEFRADGRLVAFFRRAGRNQWNLCFSLRKGEPHHGEAAFMMPMEAPQAYLGTYGWKNGALLMDVRVPAAPYGIRATLEPVGDNLRVTMKGAGTREGTTVYRRL